MVYLDATNEEYGIRRVVSDDPHNEGRYVAKVYCGVTGANLVGVENINSLDRAKDIALEQAKKRYI